MWALLSRTSRMPSKSAFGRALRSRQNRLRVSIPFVYQIRRLTSSLGPPFGGKSYAQCIDPTIDGRMAKFYGESLIKPVAPKSTTQLTAAEKNAAREAKAEALKQPKRQARLDAEAAAAEENNSAEKDDKLMSLEDLAFEDLTPVPLRQSPKGVIKRSILWSQTLPTRFEISSTPTNLTKSDILFLSTNSTRPSSLG